MAEKWDTNAQQQYVRLNDARNLHVLLVPHKRPWSTLCTACFWQYIQNKDSVTLGMIMIVGQATSTPISFTPIGRHIFHIRLELLLRGQAGLKSLNFPCVRDSNLQFSLAGDWSSASSSFFQFWFGWWCMDRRLPVQTIIILVTVTIVRFRDSFCIRLIWICGWDFELICIFIRDLSLYLGHVFEKSNVYPLRLWLSCIYRLSKFVRWRNLQAY